VVAKKVNSAKRRVGAANKEFLVHRAGQIEKDLTARVDRSTRQINALDECAIANAVTESEKRTKKETATKIAKRNAEGLNASEENTAKRVKQAKIKSVRRLAFSRRKPPRRSLHSRSTARRASINSVRRLAYSQRLTAARPSATRQLL